MYVKFITTSLRYLIFVLFILSCLNKTSFSSYIFDDFNEENYSQRNRNNYFYKKKSINKSTEKTKDKNDKSRFVKRKSINNREEEAREEEKKRLEKQNKVVKDSFSLYYTNQTTMMNYKLFIVNKYKISELNFDTKYASVIGFNYWHRFNKTNLILGIGFDYGFNTNFQKSTTDDKDWVNYDYKLSHHSWGKGEKYKFINADLYLKYILANKSGFFGKINFMLNSGIKATYSGLTESGGTKLWYYSGALTGTLSKGGLEYQQFLLLPYIGFTLSYEIGVFFTELQANVSYLNFAMQHDFHKLREDVANKHSYFLNFLFFYYDAEFKIGFKIAQYFKIFVSTGISQVLETRTRLGSLFAHPTSEFTYENQSMKHLNNFVRIGFTFEV